MDYGKSFVFMFEDRNWVGKILIGALFTLLSFILIGLPFVMGYFLEVVRRAATGRSDALPEWDALGDKFVEGLVITVILLILALPLGLFSCIWSALGPAMEQARSDMALIYLLLFLAAFGLFLIYLVLYAVVTPAIIVRYALTRSFGASLDPGAIWHIMRANFGHYILVVVLSYAASSIASFGLILCVIGVVVTVFWSYLVQAHLYGQYYRSFVSAEPPLPVAPTAP